MSISIYVVTHNERLEFQQEIYKPIQVGATLSSNKFQSITDDTGDNISKLNPYLNEVTGIYWIAKNDHASDFIGVCHYRRFFNNQAKRRRHFWRKWNYSDLITKNQLEPILTTCDGIVPIPTEFGITIRDRYYKKHYGEDWSDFSDHLKIYGLQEIFEKGGHYTHFYPFNMCIFKRQLFVDTWEKLFDPLISFIDKVDFSKYPDSRQKRAVGFLAERLFHGVVCDHLEKYNLKQLPVINTEDNSLIQEWFARSKQKISPAATANSELSCS